MPVDSHSKEIIQDRLIISYEPEDRYDIGNGEIDTVPATAVLLVTRCCKINHTHLPLDKMEAVKLSHWLHRYITGEFDE